MTKLVLAVSCLLAACAGPVALRPGDLPPVMARVAPDARVATWNRAIDVLLDEGYVPQVLNQDAGYISAKQRDDVPPDTGLVGTVVIVRVAPDGVVRVEVAGGGVYNDATELQRDLQQIQARIAAKIMAPAAPATTPTPS